MSVQILTELIPRCVQHFDRDLYPQEFDRFCAVCREYFAEPRPDFVHEFFDFLGGYTGKRFGRGSRLFDLRCFLCVYLCPAALIIGGEAEELCRALNLRWNESYPDFKFDIGSYADIASGFRTKPFGL